MNEIISLKMISELPTEIMKNSKEHNQNAVLLPKDVYDEYHTKDLKRIVSSSFSRYHNIIYLYRFPERDNIKTTPNYEIRENMLTKNNTNKVENLVEKRIQDQIWATEFYYRLLELSKKLTDKETVYLLGTFFQSLTEEKISEKLRICRNTLRKVKKSCLLKTLIEIETLI